jgi:hypothetical protein
VSYLRELCIYGVLGSSSASFVLWGIYIYLFLAQEYAAFVTWHS